MLDLGDCAFPLSALEGGSIWLSHDRYRTPAIPIILQVVEAGVAVANRLRAAAATGGRAYRAGRERIGGEPGGVDLPVEDFAEGAGALFSLRPVEGGADLREHAAPQLTLGLAEANRLSHAGLDGRVGPVMDSARVRLDGAARAV